MTQSRRVDSSLIAQAETMLRS